MSEDPITRFRSPNNFFTSSIIVLASHYDVQQTVQLLFSSSCRKYLFGSIRLAKSITFPAYTIQSNHISLSFRDLDGDCGTGLHRSLSDKVLAALRMMYFTGCLWALALQLLIYCGVFGQEIITKDIPFDLNGSNFTYQWPISIYSFRSQNAQTLEMAFMDINPTGKSNGQTAVFIHGKNFCSQTWNATAIPFLDRGYRVILIDQVGFCKSSKPVSYQFTLHGLSRNLRGLLDTIGVSKITLIGHSFGGMTAARFALLYPEVVKKLVLSDALGLENYVGEGIPYPDTDYVLATERQNNYTVLRAYEQANYYPNLPWLPAYDVWVNMLDVIYGGSQATQYTWCQALITDAVLTETIVYELPQLKMPTLVLIGENDIVAIGKAWAPAKVQKLVGHYKDFAPEVADTIPDSTFISLPGQGHAPQISATLVYNTALLTWLRTN